VRRCTIGMVWKIKPCERHDSARDRRPMPPMRPERNWRRRCLPETGTETLSIEVMAITISLAMDRHIGAKAPWMLSCHALGRAQSVHRELAAPPQAELTQKDGAGLAVARRMVGSDRVPAAMCHGDTRAFTMSFE
jgi:hypothetical protein